MNETGQVTKNQLIASLTMSPHGDYTQYVPLFGPACNTDPEFCAHLISYDALNGQVRDAHIALPLISLSVPGFQSLEFVENSWAHLASLSPRELLSAYMFANGYIRNTDVETMSLTGKDGKDRSVKHKVGGWKKVPNRLTLGAAKRRNDLDRLVARYLHARENDIPWLMGTIKQFRRPLMSLYALTHTKMSEEAQQLLYEKKYPRRSALMAISQLHLMDPREAAASIIEHKIPYLVINAALKTKAKDPAIVMAMIDRMSPTEVQSNIAMLEKFGVKDHPETRAALEDALGRVARSATKTVLKTTKAIESGGIKDEGLRNKLRDVQEKQIKAMKGVEGNWLVLADKSGSMSAAIEAGCQVAGVLTKMVRGRVGLVFFDTVPRYTEVTGKTYEEIKLASQYVTAGGGTSIGCGLLAAIERGLEPDGIAIVSDAAENNPPMFASVYASYCQSAGKNVPVYLYRVGGSPSWSDRDLAQSMKAGGHDLQEFDLRGGVDYYSLPNLVQSMNSNRYSLVDRIMETPLLTVAGVLTEEKGVTVAC